MDKKKDILRLLALSIGIAAGAFFSVPSQGAPDQNLPVKNQLQKLMQDSDRFLKVYEKEKKERKSDTNKSYKLCFDSLAKSKELAEKLGGAQPEKNVWLADALMLNARFLELNGNISASDYEQALAIRKEAFPPTSPKIAEVQNKLAYLYSRSGKVSDAADLLDSSIDIMESNKGAGATELAEAIDKCMKSGFARAVEARRITRRAARAIKKYAGNNTEALATALHAVSLCPGSNEMAHLFPNKISKPSPEETALEQALALQEKKGLISLKLAEFLETQARNQNSHSKFEDAAKTYSKVVLMREKLAANDVRLMSRTYDQHAEYLLNAKNIAQAEASKKKSLALYEKNPGADPHSLNNALSSLGSFYLSAHKPKEAAATFEKLRSLQKKQNMQTGDAEDKLVSIYLQQNDFQNANRILESKLELFHKDLGSKPLNLDYGVRRDVQTLGMIKMKLGNLDAAGKFLNRVKDGYDRSYNKNKFLYFGDRYPKDFLNLYQEYLEKSGNLSEAKVMKDRLNAAIFSEAKACPGCGRG
ncbi:MAG: tetratricopeptide repeat protein [Candidatus Melainabacteria bacterium]|nr:tetratricopeptide repeat protein [Candidatus Melainabacteria bacterium]